MKMTLIKDDIIKALLLAKGEAVSGQQLADQLGISRTAIWKHMQALQEEGYVFETVKKKGYVLVSMPAALAAGEIYSFLQTERYGRSIKVFDIVESTQLIAHEMARDGAEDGTVIIAEEQTSGRGRMARPWESAQGKGIWMTVIIRPNIPPHMAAPFTLVAAVAVTKAIKEISTKLVPEIKWPNDLLIDGKKCTGILTEMQSEPDRVQALLVGIGINVNHQQEDFSEDIHDIATSLSMEAGEMIPRAQLIAKILYYLEQYSDLYVSEGFAPIKEMWEQASCTIGKQVEVSTLREIFYGVAVGINTDGVLQVKLANGEVRSIYSGDVKIIN